jgi:hypothetical protein
MTDEISATQAAEAGRGRSAYRSTPMAMNDGRTTGGSGIQRSHLRDRKTWLKGRTRAGRTWAQRKAGSLTYCPSKQRGSEGAQR